MTYFHKFFCLISVIALTFSFIGFIIFCKTLFFCVKRYILYYFGVNTSISNIVFTEPKIKKELSPAELVRKTTLKEKINKFARETYNMVKSNNYITERSENVTDEQYQKEIKILSDIYISLDKMKINTSDELNEVEFLFNNGKLRGDSEIIDFYKKRKETEKKYKYYKSKFVNDVITTYQESELTSKLVTGIALMFISFLYFYYKFKMSDFLWTIKDALVFIKDVFVITFSPYYDEHDFYDTTYDGDHFFFSCSLILSSFISILGGWGLIIAIDWIRNIKLFKIYNKAGQKKPVDIMLGVNTATYLYCLHKILKRRS